MTTPSQQYAVTLGVSDRTPDPGERVTLTATVTPPPGPGIVVYAQFEGTADGSTWTDAETGSAQVIRNPWVFAQRHATKRVPGRPAQTIRFYRVSIWSASTGGNLLSPYSEAIAVRWVTDKDILRLETSLRYTDTVYPPLGAPIRFPVSQRLFPQQGVVPVNITTWLQRRRPGTNQWDPLYQQTVTASGIILPIRTFVVQPPTEKQTWTLRSLMDQTNLLSLFRLVQPAVSTSIDIYWGQGLTGVSLDTPVTHVPTGTQIPLTPTLEPTDAPNVNITYHRLLANNRWENLRRSTYQRSTPGTETFRVTATQSGQGGTSVDSNRLNVQWSDVTIGVTADRSLLPTGDTVTLTATPLNTPTHQHGSTFRWWRRNKSVAGSAWRPFGGTAETQQDTQTVAGEWEYYPVLTRLGRSDISNQRASVTWKDPEFEIEANPDSLLVNEISQLTGREKNNFSLPGASWHWFWILPGSPPPWNEFGGNTNRQQTTASSANTWNFRAAILYKGLPYFSNIVPITWREKPTVSLTASAVGIAAGVDISPANGEDVTLSISAMSQPSFARYMIQYIGPSGGGWRNLLNARIAGPGHSVDAPSGAAAQTWRYRALMYNRQTGGSPIADPSNEVVVRWQASTAPTRPTITLSVDNSNPPSEGDVVLSWTTDADDEALVQVWESSDRSTWASQGSSTAGSARFRIDGKVGPATYYYRAAVVDAQRRLSDYSNVVAVEWQTPAARPTITLAVDNHSPASGVDAVLTWTTDADDEALVQVWESSDRSTWTSQGRATAGRARFTIDGKVGPATYLLPRRRSGRPASAVGLLQCRSRVLAEPDCAASGRRQCRAAVAQPHRADGNRRHPRPVLRIPVQLRQPPLATDRPRAPAHHEHNHGSHPAG